MHSTEYDRLCSEILSEKYKLISFDIYDTLIERPIFKQSDIYELVALKNDFYAASYIDLRNSERNGKDLDEIYESLGRTNIIEPNILKMYKAEEERLEINLSTPRKSILKLYKKAKDSGKKIAIISDMHLKKSTIEEILKRNEIYSYDYLIISCSDHCCKSTGSSFDRLLKMLKNDDVDIKPNEILHIGDNPTSDYSIPISKGISAELIKKTITLASYTPAFKSLIKMPKNETETIFLAFLFNELFDNPYDKYMNIFNNNIESVIKIISLIMYGFSSEIINFTLSNKINNIQFISRDGYLPRRIIESTMNIRNHINYKNLLLPRIVRIPCMPNNENHTNELIALKTTYTSNITIKQFIKYNLQYSDTKPPESLINCLKDFGYDANSNQKINFTIDQYIALCKYYNWDNATSNANNVIQYIEDNLKDDDLIIDFGRRATISHFLKQHGYNCPLFQLIGKNGNFDAKTQVYNYISDPGLLNPAVYKFLENVMKIQEPKIGFIKKEDLKYSPEYVNKDFLKSYNPNIAYIQNSIIKNCKVINNLFETIGTNNHFNPYIIWNILTSLSEEDILLLKSAYTTNTEMNIDKSVLLEYIEDDADYGITGASLYLNDTTIKNNNKKS